jgi:serine/threonine-protein kinase
MPMPDVEPLARKTPERIGRYQVVERIGRGAMGLVYRARDDSMNREVALKVLTADIEDDPDIRARFHREAEAAARLSHPNIITIYDVGEDGDRFFIVMELLRGSILKEYLKLPEGARLERKLDLMGQLCTGIGAAHRASVYHRDIKPGNIFVRDDGILKILDFGVARIASSSMTASGFIVGTPDYMSPEQAKGWEIDQRSDIFSLGGVFYFMLTGRKPFPATDLPTLFHQIQSDEAPPPLGPLGIDVPPALNALIMKALSKKRETRYQTCQEMFAELETIRYQYVIDARRATIAAMTASPAPAPAPAPTVVESSATDDTVDFRPGGGSTNTDDTVALRPPTLLRRITDRIDSAISGAFTRFGRSSAPVQTRQTGTRKR